MTEQEISLSGGNVTGVVRVGQTVRRATGPWSSAVHGLLRHLESHGFAGAPRFLGLDDQMREVLTFIAGEVGHYPLQQYMWLDDNLIAIARFLRHYHDTTVGYRVPEGTVWQFPYPDHSQHEVICHNDVAPYNMVYKDEKVYALIDFDTAGPGPRIWDVAYALYRFVPLSFTQDVQALGLANPLLQRQRLRMFCQTYGLEHSYEEVLETVVRRLETMCALLLERAYDPVYQKMIADGHLDHYRREIASIKEHHLSV